MANRDKYVRKLKTQIDRLNRQAARVETQLKQYRKRRDVALAKVKRLSGASAGAWKDVAKGAKSALRDMRAAFGRARRQFRTAK